MGRRAGRLGLVLIVDQQQASRFSPVRVLPISSSSACLPSILPGPVAIDWCVNALVSCQSVNRSDLEIVESRREVYISAARRRVKVRTTHTARQEQQLLLVGRTHLFRRLHVRTHSVQLATPATTPLGPQSASRQPSRWARMGCYWRARTSAWESYKAACRSGARGAPGGHL